MRKVCDATPVWIVGHGSEFVGFSREVAGMVGISAIAMEPAEAMHRALVDVPSGVFIDGSDTLISGGKEFARRVLERADRVLIATGRRTADLDPALVAHSKTRLMLKPFELDDFEKGLRWVSGEDVAGQDCTNERAVQRPSANRCNTITRLISVAEAARRTVTDHESCRYASTGER